jgi:hypothetical protein
MTVPYSETLFEEYCRANGIACERVPVGSQRSPDFRITIDRTVVVCEVKQIDMNSTEREVVATVNSGQPASLYVSNRARSKLKNVSGQLKAAVLAGIPTMVVLYNNSPVHDYTGQAEVLQAMFGRKSWAVSFPKSQDAEPVVSAPFLGDNRGVGHGRNTSISVVAVLERNSAGQLRLRMYHNPYAELPMDPAVFSSVSAVQPVVPGTQQVEL